jgi:hypothetical protein
VLIVAAGYLGLMLLNVVAPTGLTSPRGYFNLDWITLLVMVLIAILGAIYFLAARPDRRRDPRTKEELASMPGEG